MEVIAKLVDHLVSSEKNNLNEQDGEVVKGVLKSKVVSKHPI